MRKPSKYLVAMILTIAVAITTPAAGDTPVAKRRPVDAFPAIRLELGPGSHTLSFWCHTESSDTRGLAVAAGSFEPSNDESATRWSHEFSWDDQNVVRGRLPGAESPIELDLAWSDHQLSLGFSGEISFSSSDGGVLRWFCGQTGSTTWRSESFTVDGSPVEVDYQTNESFDALRPTDFRGASVEAAAGVGLWGTHTHDFWGYAIGRLGGERGTWILETPSSSERSKTTPIEFAKHSPGTWNFGYRRTFPQSGYVLWLAELRFVVCSEAQESGTGTSGAVKPVACQYAA